MSEREAELAYRRAFATLIAIMVAAITVAAHMKAAKTEPAADSTLTSSPARVQVWFTQVPDPKLTRLDVTGPAGPVKLNGFKVNDDKSAVATVEGTLANGRYTVRWQSAGDDGHVQKGEFAFSVKQAN
jgi:methionine-rich copper-binding protein CopC